MAVKLSVASPISLKADGADGKTLFVKGFASTAFKDRQGDVIPPEKFDIPLFMKNPQLWIDHQKWNRKSDGNSVPIGLVDSMYAARVEVLDGGGFNVLNLEDDAIVDTISKSDAENFVVKTGDKGLWVVAKVMEPDVIPYVKDGRYNAFSWSGMIERADDGRIKRIELLEVSVVAVPANGRALFMLGKNLADPSVVELRSYTGSAFVELPEEKTLLPSQAPEGSAYRVELFDGTSQLLLDLSSESLNAAKADAGLLHQVNGTPVALFKNTWKRDVQGRPVYRLVAAYSNEEVPTMQWTKAYVDDLPDASFAYIAPGGDHDEEGKTIPRSLRHFPFKDMDGTLSGKQVQRALAELPGSDLPIPVRNAVIDTLSSAAKELGIQVPDALQPMFTVRLKELLNDTEQRLLKALLPKSDEEPEQVIITPKGGDDMTTEELKALTDSIAALHKTMEDISSRMEKLETKSEDPVDEPTEPSEEEEKKSEDANVLMDVLTKFGESLANISKRLEKLESTPSKSQAATEEAAEKSEKHEDESTIVNFESVAKHLGATTPDAQKALKKSILAEALIPKDALRIS